MREEEKKKLISDNKTRLTKEMSKYIEASKEDRENEKQERADIKKFCERDDVQQVFENYGQQLKQMYDFYAAQDDHKDLIAYESKLLSETLSFREFIKFGFQQRLIPEFISPDEMVQIYKNLIREQKTNEHKDETLFRQHEVIGYKAFKKALVRVAVSAQEKLQAVDAGDDVARALDEQTFRRRSTRISSAR